MTFESMHELEVSSAFWAPVLLKAAEYGADYKILILSIAKNDQEGN